MIWKGRELMKKNPVNREFHTGVEEEAVEEEAFMVKGRFPYSLYVVLIMVTFMFLCEKDVRAEDVQAGNDTPPASYDLGDVEVKGSDSTALGVGEKDVRLYDSYRQTRGLRFSDEKLLPSATGLGRENSAAEEVIEPRENWFSIHYGSHDLLGYELFDTFRVGTLQDAVFLFGGSRDKSDGHRPHSGFSLSRIKLDSGVNLAGDSTLGVKWNIERRKQELPGPVTALTPRARLDDTLVELDIQFEHLRPDASRWNLGFLYSANKREVDVPDIAVEIHEKYTDDLIKLNLEYIPSIDSQGFLSFGYSYSLDEIKRHPLAGSQVAAGSLEASNHALWIQREILPGPETLLVLFGRLDSHSLVSDQASTGMKVTHHMDTGWKLVLDVGKEFDPSSFSDQYFPLDYIVLDPADAFRAPETSYVGLKSEHILESDTQVSLSLRREGVDNHPVYQDDMTTGRYDLVYRNATIWKAEARASMVLSEDLFGSVSYSFISTEDQFGKDVPFIPMNEWLVSLGYHFNESVSFGIDERFVGKRYAEAGNAFRLDRYILLGFTANVRLSDVLKAYLRVDNLFDKGYQLRRNYPQPGREIKVGMKVLF